MQELENLRHNFSRTNRPIINLNNDLNIEPVVIINPITRINNYIKSALPARIVLDAEELEEQRIRDFGQKVDVSSSQLVDFLKSKLVKIPKIKADGTIETDDDGNNIMEENSLYNILVQSNVGSALKQMAQAREIIKFLMSGAINIPPNIPPNLNPINVAIQNLANIMTDFKNATDINLNALRDAMLFDDKSKESIVQDLINDGIIVLEMNGNVTFQASNLNNGVNKYIYIMADNNEKKEKLQA